MSVGRCKAWGTTGSALVATCNITAVCIINCRSNTTAFVWPPNSMSVGDPGISVKGHSHYKICASVGLSGLASGLPMKSCRDMGPGDLPISHGRWQFVWRPNKSWGDGPAVYYANDCNCLTLRNSLGTSSTLRKTERSNRWGMSLLGLLSDLPDLLFQRKICRLILHGAELNLPVH